MLPSYARWPGHVSPVALTPDIPRAKSKAFGPGEAADNAARYLVCKLYVPVQAIAGSWQPVSMLGESAATVVRAVERGWVIVRDEVQGNTKVRYAALTDEGRRMARRTLR